MYCDYQGRQELSDPLLHPGLAATNQLFVPPLAEFTSSLGSPSVTNSAWLEPFVQNIAFEAARNP
jgi:hypothetical protein